MRRCFGDGDPVYERYHDTEWGFPVPDERALFELLSLEAFQAGLSWRTILAKRDAFRRAFANFDADAVARFDPADVKRLLEDVSSSIGRPDRQKLVAGFGLVGLPKGEGCQVHVPFRQNVNGENALACLKTNLRDSQRNPPVVPLPPGQWVGCVECGGDRQRPGSRLSIQIQ